jgi:integrase
MDALARSYLRSADFARLADQTKSKRRSLIEQFCLSYGKLPVASLERQHVKKMMDGLANTPGKARNVLSMLRILMALAIDEDIRKDDPCAGIKRPKLSAEGWHTWTEEEISRFESHYPIGTQARLAFALALYTAQRSADLIKMGKQHLRNRRLEIRQQKTQNEVSIPLHADLVAILDATPSGQQTLPVSKQLWAAHEGMGA